MTARHLSSTIVDMETQTFTIIIEDVETESTGGIRAAHVKTGQLANDAAPGADITILDAERAIVETDYVTSSGWISEDAYCDAVALGVDHDKIVGQR